MFRVNTFCSCRSPAQKLFVDAFNLLPQYLYDLKLHAIYADNIPTNEGMKNIRDLDTTIYPYIPISTPRHISDRILAPFRQRCSF